MPADRRPVAAAAFLLITAVFLPVMAVGYVMWIVKLYASRGRGASGTAQGPLSARWVQHRLGTRSDEPAARLLTRLPDASPIVVWLVFGPMLLAHRATGYVPATFRYPFEGKVTLRNQASARQTFYDQAVDRYLPRVDQLVLLGAGFDTRTLRLAPGSTIRCFEVDTAKTISVKLAALAAVGIDPTPTVTFVAADFDTEDWLERLSAAGFDHARPSLLLWEGVTPYLTSTAVADTLARVGSMASGTVVAFDYLTSEVLHGRSLAMRLLRASLRSAHEPLTFGLDATPPVQQRVVELLAPVALTLIENHVIGGDTETAPAAGGYVVAVAGRSS